MAVNHYFNNYNSKYSEQRLIEDLLVESIKIMGFDAYYLANNNDAARDLLYGEDPVKKFESAFMVEMYMSSIMEYSGERELFSKFGLEIKNNMEVVVSKRSFSERVPQNLFTRPREGDLIYIPFGNGTGELFEITFVEQNKDMMMLGRKYPFFYEIRLEKFKYAQELINTGISDIDLAMDNSAYSIDLQLGSGTGTYASKEIVYQSYDGTLANAITSAIVQSWNDPTNMLVVTNIAGEFIDGLTIIGSSTGAVYTLSNYDTMAPNVHNEIYDNKLIENNASSVIDFSESNPFGSI
jgi:hypothetical protein